MFSTTKNNYSLMDTKAPTTPIALLIYSITIAAPTLLLLSVYHCYLHHFGHMQTLLLYHFHTPWPTITRISLFVIYSFHKFDACPRVSNNSITLKPCINGKIIVQPMFCKFLPRRKYSKQTTTFPPPPKISSLQWVIYIF